MALKDLLALIDDKLETIFNTKGYDAAKDRSSMIKKIDATRSRFLSTEPLRGRRDFTVANNVVAYSPTLSGKPIEIAGNTTSYIPSERFTQFLDLLKKEVEAGSLDDALEAASADGPTPQKKERKPSRAWTPERRAKQAATIAARNAAKG